MARSENLIVFRGAQKGRTCVRVFVEVGVRTCTSILIRSFFGQAIRYFIVARLYEQHNMAEFICMEYKIQ